VSIAIRSFAKINLGLKIGPSRADGFHELRTVYQTIALHDVVRVELADGDGIEIRCEDARVPLDARNTCWKVAERVLRTFGRQSRVVITIEKRLPVQGGMGAASSNAVAAMLGLERALGIELSSPEKMRIAAEVGSDLPLFLIGGTVLGVDHGQEVYALQDLPEIPMVVVTPPIGVSTPKAFQQWDALVAVHDCDSRTEVRESGSKTSGLDAGLKASSIQNRVKEATTESAALTGPSVTGTIKQFDRAVYAWLSKCFLSPGGSAEVPASGVPARGGDRAETPLLDRVRTGIENDFERVVFPENPELREVKNVLQREGARYASLSGSGSTLYGLYDSANEAEAAAERMRGAGHIALATRTVGRAEYWRELFALGD